MLQAKGTLVRQTCVPHTTSSAAKARRLSVAVQARTPPARTKPNWKLEKKDRLIEGGEPVWYPGATPPAYLDGSLPGDRGFDPLRIAEKFRIGEGPEDGNGLPWLVEGELANGRIAMLASAGILAAELTGHGPWFTAVQRADWPLPYWPGIWSFHLLFAAYEWSRWQNFRNVGETGFIYAPFDPLVKANDYRRQSEVRNARLAMVAQLGFWTQAWATGTDPIQNLNDHLADPWGQNILTNARGAQVLVFLVVGGFSLLFLESANAIQQPSDAPSKQSAPGPSSDKPNPSSERSRSDPKPEPAKG